MENINFAVFECLLKAPSKDYIARLLQEAFLNRDTTHLSQAVLRSISEQLDIDAASAETLLRSLASLINKVVFESRNELAEVQAVFAGSPLQANLVSLVSKLVHEKLAGFKKTLTDSQSKSLLKLLTRRKCLILFWLLLL